MSQDIEQRALAACIEYDRWPREIERLTHAIADLGCSSQNMMPVEAFPDIGGEGWDVPTEPTCFNKASTEEIPPLYPDHAPGRRNLAQIAEVVADCPECSRLCDLIRERKEARQRWGVAKREVRSVARAAARARETTP